MNPKEFMTRWIEGMKNLTPSQQLHAKMVGHAGASVGLTLALVMVFFKGVWYFSVFIFFMIWLQVVAWIGARQQYNNSKELFETITGINDSKDKYENLMEKLGR